jgi:hypothetical protein
MVGAYNIRRKRNPKTYADDTFGSLVHWYTHEYPKFQKLADATKADLQHSNIWKVSSMRH